MLNNEGNCASLDVLNTIIEDMAQLPVVTARQEGATEIRVFVLEEEKDELKQVAARKNVAVSHLLRALALAWIEENAIAQQQDESA